MLSLLGDPVLPVREVACAIVTALIKRVRVCTKTRCLYVCD